jgi:hypothetical protein
LDVKTILKSYPRNRPILSWDAHKIYEQEYSLNREGKTTVTKIVEWLESWMHKQIAKQTFHSVLELGAGTLNHIQYERENVCVYDIVEPFKNLYLNSKYIHKIRNIYDYLSDIPLSSRYERILSIAVLEHMTDLPKELALSVQHLEKDGVFQAGIPSEGAALWGLAWRCSTGISYRLRTGLSYEELMRFEHVNRADEILALVRYFFETVTIKRFPLPFFHSSFYTYIEARNPIMDNCWAYLEKDKFAIS